MTPRGLPSASRRRFELVLALAAAGLAVPAFFACVGSDSAPGVTESDGGAEAGDSGNPISAEDGAVDGASSDGGSGGCPEASTFSDDFEGRAGVQGCWDSFTRAARFDASAALEPLGGGTTSFHIVAGAAPQGPVEATTLAKAIAVKVPAVLKWKFLVNAIADLGDSRSGYYALKVLYTFTGGSSPASTYVGVGVPNATTVNPYLQGGSFGGPYVPRAGWHSAELRVDAAVMTLEVDGVVRSTLDLSAQPPVEIVGIELGMTAGTVIGAIDVAYDDVVVGN